MSDQSSGRGLSTNMFRLLLLICVVLFAIDIVNLAAHVFKNYGTFQAEALPNFYGFFALAMVAVLVIVSRLISAVVARDEGYYDHDLD